MRTFKQYIREAVDFRLGGDQKKGFEQNIANSLNDIEVGDILYFYYNEKHTDLPLREYKVYEIKKTSQLNIEFYISKDKTASLVISKKSANDEYAYTRSGSIISVDPDILLEVVKMKYNRSHTIDDIEKCYE